MVHKNRYACFEVDLPPRCSLVHAHTSDTFLTQDIDVEVSNKHSTPPEQHTLALATSDERPKTGSFTSPGPAISHMRRMSTQSHDERKSWKNAQEQDNGAGVAERGGWDNTQRDYVQRSSTESKAEGKWALQVDIPENDGEVLDRLANKGKGPPLVPGMEAPELDKEESSESHSPARKNFPRVL